MFRIYILGIEHSKSEEGDCDDGTVIQATTTQPDLSAGMSLQGSSDLAHMVLMSIKATARIQARIQTGMRTTGAPRSKWPIKSVTRTFASSG
jgi:hypothetical protein